MTTRQQWLIAREAVLEDESKVFSEQPDWFQVGPRTLELGPVVVDHFLSSDFSLDVVGRGTIFGEFSISLRAANRVQLLRLCRYDDHRSTGWHGLRLPADPREPHEDAPALAGITRDDAFIEFCRRSLIDMPEQLRLGFEGP